ARGPRVLTDGNTDAYAADDEERAVGSRGGEVALLVEHRVGRQQVLVVNGEHPPVGPAGGRVVETPPGLGKADPRRRPAGASGQFVEHLGSLGYERGTEEQVLRWIP